MWHDLLSMSQDTHECEMPHEWDMHKCDMVHVSVTWRICIWFFAYEYTWCFCPPYIQSGSFKNQTHTHAHTHRDTHTHSHTHTYTHTHTHAHTHTHTHILFRSFENKTLTHTHTNIRTHTHTHKHALSLTHTNTCTLTRQCTHSPSGSIENKKKSFSYLDYGLPIVQDEGTFIIARHCNTLRHTATHCNTLFVSRFVWIAQDEEGTANPTWGDIFESSLKAQSSKLERLFALKRGKRDVWAWSFELWNSFRKRHPKWDRLYLYHCHTLQHTAAHCNV